ncbi:hypothetical protein A33I_20070 [Alkalihalophilus marmarensis DSM 21297]|uniref:Uncharacterized protein n=1 Tax=Alkalihalophilus marmarensis DSM 21297 TaxID=1188261 RepID=U6SJR4_9BACI|nr:hypothetical protein A33I_20070 [Alkalihalophilus marmarensis DSM 21297]
MSINQYLKVLELERALNDLRVSENKLNYELGVKDGMEVWKELKE